MSRRILNLGVMKKIARKRGVSNIATINKMVSARAAKHGISPEAALLVLAKEYGVGTAVYQRTLSPDKISEARVVIANTTTAAPHIYNGVARRASSLRVISKKMAIRQAIESLLQDKELRERCSDLLLASKHFDRAINQATTVLEDRIRRKAQLTQSAVGENLVNLAFKEDPSLTILKVASGEKDDQRGFTQILRGIVPSFRNKTHHHVVNTFSREEAMRVCGFIDVLLRVVDSSTKI